MRNIISFPRPSAALPSISEPSEKFRVPAQSRPANPFTTRHTQPAPHAAPRTEAVNPWRPSPNPGPYCQDCKHPSCRARRAERLPRLGGRRSEFAEEHANAAKLQARHRNLVIWFGEATQSYWVATSHGLVEGRDIDALLLALWPHTSR
ncbi:hypothetical protein ACOALZ_15355 [Nocardiopsis algeriensis]|uniref:hypothetical protein n=1 Tax=Nocardiopsis algeriensis TaxID=1478215 RepID=UPI003B43C079